MRRWILGIMAVLVLAGAASVAARTLETAGRQFVLRTTPTRSRAGTGTAAWRTRVVVPMNRIVDTSSLAVAESGDAAVAWVQGKGRPVCACGYTSEAWHGQKVMVKRGTVTGGFGKPRELTTNVAGTVWVAELSSGATYVAWDESLPRSSLQAKLVVIRSGHVSRPVVFPHGLSALVSDGSGKVAAVWGTWDSTHFAFLGPNGQPQRARHIPIVVDAENETPAVAINDGGDLAFVGNRYRKHRNLGLMLVLCRATRGCAAPVLLPARGGYEATAVALSDSGTATALGGGNHGSLWGVVAHVGRAAHRLRTIALAGNWPVAAAQGRTGAVALFEPTGDTAALTFLKPKTDAFTTPRPIPDPHVETAPVPVLAASSSGEFVAAWGHFLHYGSTANKSNDELRASVGSGSTPGRPVTIAPVSDFPWWASLQTGIDAHGDAVVTWSRFGSQGNHGLTEAIHIYH